MRLAEEGPSRNIPLCDKKHQGLWEKCGAASFRHNGLVCLENYDKSAKWIFIIKNCSALQDQTNHVFK